MPTLSYTHLVPQIASALGPAPTRGCIEKYLVTHQIRVTQRLVTQLQQQLSATHVSPAPLTIAHAIAHHLPQFPSQKVIALQAAQRGWPLSRSGLLAVTAQLQVQYPALWPSAATTHPVWTCAAQDLPLLQAFLSLTGLPPNRVVLFILRGFVLALVTQKMRPEQALLALSSLGSNELTWHAQSLSRFSVATVLGTATRHTAMPKRLHMTLQPVDQALVAMINAACDATRNTDESRARNCSELSALSMATRFLLHTIGRHRIGVLPLAQEIHRAGALMMYQWLTQCSADGDAGNGVI